VGDGRVGISVARRRTRFRGLAGGSGLDIKTRELVRRARTVETLVVSSEEEAFILEANLIKEHRPRFNIQLRDDKKYPYVKVTVNEPFPRAYVTRRVREDGSRYFGPFVSVGRVRRALDLVKCTHGIRSCRYDLPRDAPPRPCLDHHIGRCAAPCVGLQSRDEYRHMIDRLLRILAGDVAKVQAEVEQEMHKASSELDFERAARLRDVLAGLDGIARRQRVHVVGGGDQDSRTTWLHLYAQDDWRARDNLTINYGLRYEYNAHMKDVDNRLSSIDLSVPGGRFVVASDDAGNISPAAEALMPLMPIPWVTSAEIGWDRSLLRPSRVRLAPRAGFALLLGDQRSVVLRGGYGVFLNQWAYSVQTAFTRNLPFFFLKQIDTPSDQLVPTHQTRDILIDEVEVFVSA